MATFLLIAAAGLTATLGVMPAAHHPTDPAAIQAARTHASSLNPGINLWRWFRRPMRMDDDHYANYMSDDELRMLRNWGFRSVRLPLGEPFLFPDGHLQDAPNPKSVDLLRAAIARINAAGLVVVVDYHPAVESKAQIETDPAQQAMLARMWLHLAAALADTSPDKVLFEALNEPHFKYSASGWNALARQLHDAIRVSAPRHTIVIDTSMAADPDRLSDQDVLDDGNVIYSVHFYKPMIFTTQGSSNGKPNLTGLPWPQPSEVCAAVSQAAPDQAGPIRAYCAQGDKLARMDSEIAALASWEHDHQRPVWIGEFGAAARGIDPQSRKAWFHAAAAAFARHKLPASLWSYDDCWGLQMKVACNVPPVGPLRQTPSEAPACVVLRAMGLPVPDCERQVSAPRQKG